MAYTKTTWTEATGITTTRLNNLETQHDKAVTEAISMVNNAKPVIGSYTGTDSSVNLNLGFMPKFVIILASANTSTEFDYIGVLAFPGEYQQTALHWTSPFRIGSWIDFRSTGIDIPNIFSVNGVKYNYIAFR